MMKKLLFFFVLLFSQLSTFAQIVQDPTTWKYVVEKTADKEYKLFFKLAMKPHWHIWSMNPGGDGLQIPPSFEFKKSSDYTLVGKTTESGKKITQEMDGVDGIVNYFENAVIYTQKVKVNKNTTIKGVLTYQVCDESQCLPPKDKDFEFKIEDIKNADTAVAATEDTTTTAVTEVDTTATSNDIDTVTNAVASTDGASNDGTSNSNESTNTATEEGADTSIWTIFITGLGAGLMAVVTPCIYSMIPITVSFFTKKSKTRSQGIRNAFIYSASIIIIFGLLGMGITAFFGASALNNLATNWIANLFFFVIFLVFAFSFLGAFELTLPSSFTNKINSKGNTNSIGGIFFMAFTLVLVSFSCTSGFIGGLAVVASKGGVWGPMVGFASFGLGIALPFAIFAIFPSYLKNLEKPGGWQNAVKVTLGFVELALALKFLSNADLAQGWRILDREVFIAIWAIIAILLGFYLLGKLKFSHDDELPKNMFGISYISIPRLLFAGTAFCFAIYLIPGMWGAPLKAVSSFVPPMATQDFILGGNVGGGHSASSSDMPAPVKYADKLSMYEPQVVKTNGLVTYFDLEEGKEVARKLNRPIFLDFTGITCVNCRKMEGEVWSDAEVLKRLKEDFVIVSLYCDFDRELLPENEQYFSKILNMQVKSVGDKNEDYQATTFGSNTQPFYFFIDADDTKLADKGYQYDPNIQKFIDHLDAVKAKYKALHP